MSRNRLEYLCRLFGKPIPADVDLWNKPIERAHHRVPSANTPPTRRACRRTRRASNERITGFGVALDARDRADHRSLPGRSSSPRGSTRGTRASAATTGCDYPSFGQLMLETDRAGKADRLSRRRRRRFSSFARCSCSDRIVPVVGNVAGDKAVKAIGAYAKEHGLKRLGFLSLERRAVSHRRDGGFDEYAENVKTLPHDSTSVIIRSYFGRFGVAHPLLRPGRGNVSTSMIERYRLVPQRFQSRASSRPIRTWCSTATSSRDGDARRAEPAAEVRILALGDSYTIGEGVADGRPLARSPRGDAACSRHSASPTPMIIARTGWTTDELSAGIDAARPSVPIRSRDAADRREQSVSRPIDEEYRAQFRALLDRAVAFAGGSASHVVVVSIPDWGVTPFASGRDRPAIAARDRPIQRGQSGRGRAVPARTTPTSLRSSRRAAADPSLIARGRSSSVGSDVCRMARRHLSDRAADRVVRVFKRRSPAASSGSAFSSGMTRGAPPATRFHETIRSAALRQRLRQRGHNGRRHDPEASGHLFQRRDGDAAHRNGHALP